ncbi:MAG TPA: hypothetical protein VGY58_05165 [Gemmataceae bacterium]|nr:hypothetical protein [Gemmataceae bacterium]
MRPGFAVFVLMLASPALQAQQDQDATPPRRYGVLLNQQTYPQEDPKQALASVVKAIDRQRVDYLLAHLADPDFVDERVKEVYGGNFDELVKETTTKLKDNPTEAKLLERFLKEGEWDAKENTATASLKDVKDRQVFVKKVGKSWYLENRQKAENSK